MRFVELQIGRDSIGLVCQLFRVVNKRDTIKERIQIRVIVGRVFKMFIPMSLYKEAQSGSGQREKKSH